MKENHKRKGMNKTGIVNPVMALIIVVAIIFIISDSGNPGSIILKGDANTFYQYSGDIPNIFSQHGKGGVTSEYCDVDETFKNEDIVFSDRQVISVGENEYQFTSTNIRTVVAQNAPRGGQYTSPCNSVLYNMRVLKNDVEIDRIAFETPNSCNDLNTQVTRDYGDIVANFGHREEIVIDLTRCVPRLPNSAYAYTIHQYKIKQPTQTDTTTQPGQSTESKPEVVIAEPSNKKLVVSKAKGFFERFWDWLRGLFS